MTDKIKASELPSLIGREFGPSSWIEITQDRVNQFADATNDHQFIHVDEERAAQTPFRGTIAHGFLTMSLVSCVTAETFPDIENMAMAINYGSDKVRFLRPVRVGSRVRARLTLLEATEKSPGQWLTKTAVTMDIENQENPAMYAEVLAMMIVR